MCPMTAVSPSAAKPAPGSKRHVRTDYRIDVHLGQAEIERIDT